MFPPCSAVIESRALVGFLICQLDATPPLKPVISECLNTGKARCRSVWFTDNWSRATARTKYADGGQRQLSSVITTSERAMCW